MAGLYLAVAIAAVIFLAALLLQLEAALERRRERRRPRDLYEVLGEPSEPKPPLVPSDVDAAFEGWLAE